MHRIGLVVGVVVAFLAGGCGGGSTAECTSLCKDAQSKSCTSIKGDCAAFCTAIDAVAPTAKCTSQRDSYLSCLSSAAHPCDANCDQQETALGTCMGVYCLLNATNKDCQTITTALK